MKSILGILGSASKNSTMTSGVETGGDDDDHDEEELRTRMEQQPREVNFSEGELEDEEDDDEFFKVPNDLNEAEMTTVLQQLAGDAQLHKLLADERMRCETHKINYSKLKGEYMRLIHENQVLTSEVNKAEQSRHASHEATNMLSAQAQTSIHQLTVELEAAQTLLPTEAERIDLENKIFAENEARWKMRVQQLSEDVEASKLSVQNLLQENLLLKTGMLHSEEEAEMMKEEMQLKAGKKILSLEKQVAASKSSHHPKLESLEAELEALAKANTKLKSKVKFLELHLDDNLVIERERETSVAQTTAEQSKSEAFLGATIKRIEAENAEAEASLRKTRNESTNLRLKVQELVSDLNHVRAQLKSRKDVDDDRENQFQATLNAIKMSATKERATMQCELDRANSRLKAAEKSSVRSSSEAESVKQEMEQLKRGWQEEAGAGRAEEAKRSAELEVRLSEVTAVNRSLHVQLEELGSELHRRTSTAAPSEANHGLQQEVQALQEQMEGLREENGGLRRANEDCREDLRRAREAAVSPVRKEEEGKNRFDIGIQVDFERSSSFSEEQKLRKQIQELQSKQKKFAELLDRAPPEKN